MGGACISANKNKKIKANQKDEEKKDKENEDKENEKKGSKNNDKEKEKKLDEGEYTFKIINEDKEYTEKVKSSEKISYLFNVISKYKEKKYSEYDLIYKDDISLVSKLTEDISEVFKDEENKDNISLNMLYLGLKISFNIKKDYEESNTLIAQPLFDLGGNVGLLIYHKFEKTFSSEILKSEKLLKFNHLSAYCNCKNVLYICGGESKENIGTNNRNYISNFIKIDLFKSELINELPNLEQSRAWHSMIFIPPKYIFIVGGDTKTVELFDIEKQKLTPDSEMNEIRNECTLFCLNDSILYAVSGLSTNGNYVKDIEKCNLRAAEREWKIVKLKKNDIEIQNCFYISCFVENSTKIILFAANENENHNYDSLEFEDNEEEGNISLFNSNVKVTDVCPDKIFHPINDNMSILIPLIGNNVSVYLIKNDLKLEKKSFPDALKQIYD